MPDLFDYGIVVTPVLPIKPSPGTDARRIVRHGLADVLAWLGEDVGPRPGAQTHAVAMPGGLLAVSPALGLRLRSIAHKMNGERS